MAGVFALIPVAYIVLFVFESNPANPHTLLVRDLAMSLMPWFGGLITPDDPKIGVTVNYGLAAVFWLVAGSIVARLLRAAR
ncbi:MAG: hypothetical protein ACT4RN_04225 [Pseudonocardia sp.]